jgi:hypothetical protein
MIENWNIVLSLVLEPILLLGTDLKIVRIPDTFWILLGVVIHLALIVFVLYQQWSRRVFPVL